MEVINPKMIGDINKSKIIELIKKQPISRAEIANVLNISRPAVTKNVNALIELGIVREGKTDDAPYGRKPQLLEFNASFAYVMGINIMSKTVQIVLADLTGKIIDKEDLMISDKNDSIALYNQICRSITQIVNRRNIRLEDIYSVGISSPGIQDPKTGGHLLNPFLNGWDQLNLVEMFKNDLNLDCSEYNDVDMSAMGERLKGKGKDCSNFVYIKLWDGFAARYMMDGQIYRGVNNAAGEIGFMLLGEEFIQDKIEASGKLEKMVGNAGISELYTQLSGNEGERDIKEILRLSKSSDKTAIEIVNKLIVYVSMAIVNIASVLDPEMVILGGDLINLDDEHIDRITNLVSRNFPFTPRIVKSELAEKSEIIGCISVALENASKKLQLLW